MSWLQDGSQKTCYFGEEIMLLFPQEMRDCGLVPGWYGVGLIEEYLLKIKKETRRIIKHMIYILLAQT